MGQREIFYVSDRRKCFERNKTLRHKFRNRNVGDEENDLIFTILEETL